MHSLHPKQDHKWNGEDQSYSHSPITWVDTINVSDQVCTTATQWRSYGLLTTSILSQKMRMITSSLTKRNGCWFTGGYGNISYHQGRTAFKTKGALGRMYNAGLHVAGEEAKWYILNESKLMFVMMITIKDIKIGEEIVSPFHLLSTLMLHGDCLLPVEYLWRPTKLWSSLVVWSHWHSLLASILSKWTLWHRAVVGKYQERKSSRHWGGQGYSGGWCLFNTWAQQKQAQELAKEKIDWWLEQGGGEKCYSIAALS